MRYLIILGLILILLPITLASVSYEDDGNFITLHNEIETYYIKKSSGIQYTQDRDKFFSKNIICMEIQKGNNFISRCANNDSFNYIGTVTDRETYATSTWYKTINILGKYINFSLAYNLTANDSKLYIKPKYKTDVVGEHNITFYWGIHKINIDGPGNDILHIGREDINLNTTSPRTFRKNNINYNGFIVEGSETGRYFYFGYNYEAINFSILLRRKHNRPNAAIIYKAKILERTQQQGSTTFEYYDPPGDCPSIFDDILASHADGCFGNQFGIDGKTTLSMTAGKGDRLDYRFNLTTTDDRMLSALGVCIDSVGAGFVNPNISIGVQYNGASDRPNGTWVDFQTITSFSTGCITYNMLNLNNMTANEIYHVVIDEDGNLGGKAITFRYGNPSIKKLPFDYSDHPLDIVAKWSSAGQKWVTQIGDTPLYTLRLNKTNNIGMRDDNYYGFPYDPLISSSWVLYGNLVGVQKFKIPFNFSSNAFGMIVGGNTNGTAPADNLSFYIFNAESNIGIESGEVPSNQSFFNDSLFYWLNGTIDSTIDFEANITYGLQLFCNSCAFNSGWKWWYGQTQSTLLLYGNTTFGSLENYATISTNNGTSLIIVSGGTSDYGFRFYGNQTNPPKPPGIIVNGPIGTLQDFVPFLNFTIENLLSDAAWFSIDGGITNTTLCTNCIGTKTDDPIVLQEGDTTIDIFVNNSFGINTNQTNVTLDMENFYKDLYGDNSSIEEIINTSFGGINWVFITDSSLKGGNITSYAMNTSKPILKILNITWSETTPTDADQNITVELSVDDGKTWFEVFNATGYDDFVSGNILKYRILFNAEFDAPFPEVLNFDTLNITWLQGTSEAEKNIKMPMILLMIGSAFIFMLIGINLTYNTKKNNLITKIFLKWTKVLLFSIVLILLMLNTSAMDVLSRYETNTNMSSNLTRLTSSSFGILIESIMFLWIFLAIFLFLLTIDVFIHLKK